MPKSLSKPAQQLREYLLQPSERNEDLAISYFRSLYPDAFRRQSDAANADGYVPGHFLLELKGDPNAWYSALFQALAYENKHLAFSLVIVCTKGFLAVWRKEDIPESIREEILADPAAPSTIGRKYAKKYAGKRSGILRTTIWYRAELSGELFVRDDELFLDLLHNFERTLTQQRRVRQPITLHNFAAKLKEMRVFFDPAAPIKAARAFYSMIYGPWDDASVLTLSQRHDDRATLAGAEISNLVPSRRLKFKAFVENHMVRTGPDENIDDFFARFDQALDAVDKDFRIKHGIFFTDLDLSKFVMWLIKQTIPNLGKNYLVVDPACGSGNLVTNWRSPLELRHKVVSEIEPELLYAVEQRMRGDQWHNGRFTVVPKVTEGKGLNFLDKSAADYLDTLIEHLAEKGVKADKPIAFLCNPPYRSDDDQAATGIAYEVHPSIVSLIGADAASERYCCFLAQMKLICDQAKESGLPDRSVLLLFTETSWLTNRPIFRQVRYELLKSFEAVDGIVVNSKQFFDVRGSFPIAFTIWLYRSAPMALDGERPIVLRDTTWVSKQQLAALPWHDSKSVDTACEEILADKRTISVPFGMNHERISVWAGQTMTDFKRSRRKDEKIGDPTGGLPSGDSRIANKKAYGERDGRIIGFMDDLTPCRTRKGSNGVPWFRLNPQFMDCQKTRMFSGPPSHFGYSAGSLESAKRMIVWYSLARTFRHTAYPLWAHNSEMWPIETTPKKREVVNAYCMAIAYAENDCLQISFPSGNPAPESIEVFVQNPMTKLDPDCYWMRTLRPYVAQVDCQDAKALIATVDKVYDEWKKELGHRSELAVPYERSYLLGKARLGIGSGLVQIRDYAEEVQCQRLTAAVSDMTARLKEVKEKFYEVLLSDVRYFSNVRELKRDATSRVFAPTTKFEKILEKRLAVAGLLVSGLHADVNFGRTKFVKLFYLADASIGSDLKMEYAREAAGPLDQRALYNSKIGIEALADRYQYFSVRSEGKFVRYLRRDNLDGLVRRAKQILGKNEVQEINRVIELFRDLKTEQAEIIATLYACWNDILLERPALVNDAIITREFLKHWHPAKSRFSRSRLAKALAWMRSNNMVPNGKGRVTVETAQEQIAG